MPGASDYTKANILSALLRGVALPLPAGTYVSLHTADPAGTGANEVTLGNWPGYLRRKAEGAGSIGSGWGAPAAGVSSNSNQLIYPNNNGASSITVTHFAIWDALTGGNAINSAILTTARTLLQGDILVFDIAALTVAVS